jgi:serine phosphatase RsbU (regulator of sigma subunit)
MTPAAVTKPSLIDWAVAARPLAGQAVSGDLHLVKRLADRALLAVVDGVGHGDQATAAATAAISILDKHADESVISLLNRCHKALTKTRGVVMTLASVEARENTVTWLGVGNVEGRLLRADAGARPSSESVLLWGGLVGYQLPPLQARILPVAAGDLLIFATDGIDAEFGEEVNLCDAPGQIAHRILSRHFKGTDDALALVARYLGMDHE